VRARNCGPRRPCGDGSWSRCPRLIANASSTVCPRRSPMLPVSTNTPLALSVLRTTQPLLVPGQQHVDRGAARWRSSVVSPLAELFCIYQHPGKPIMHCAVAVKGPSMRRQLMSLWQCERRGGTCGGGDRGLSQQFGVGSGRIVPSWPRSRGFSGHLKSREEPSSNWPKLGKNLGRSSVPDVCRTETLAPDRAAGTRPAARTARFARVFGV